MQDTKTGLEAIDEGNCGAAELVVDALVKLPSLKTGNGYEGAEQPSEFSHATRSEKTQSEKMRHVAIAAEFSARASRRCPSVALLQFSHGRLLF